MSMLHKVDTAQFRFDFCCKGKSQGVWSSTAEQSGSQVILCPLDLSHIGFVRRMTDVIRNGRYDVVHNHLELYSGIGVWISRYLHVPVITSFHNTHFAP